MFHLSISEMQINTTLRFHLTLIRMSKVIKTNGKRNIGMNVGTEEHYILLVRSSKMHVSFKIIFLFILQKPHICIQCIMITSIPAPLYQLDSDPASNTQHISFQIPCLFCLFIMYYYSSLVLPIGT